MNELIECVPNFSTSDPEVIHALHASVSAFSSVQILNSEADIDYNRVVITFVVSPDECVDAVKSMIHTALDLIDMREHQGQHPRIGAVDVFPLIPLKNTTFDQCIDLARKIGKNVGQEMQVPVYLYGKAAQSKERIILAKIRKGEYEGLKDKLSDIKWKPDFGPASFVPQTGAIVIGVRNILIAYNINLATINIGIATKIARKIRSSGWYLSKNDRNERVPGLLEGVQAMGVKLNRNQRIFVQVSTNVLDYENKSSVHKVFETIKQEALNQNVEVTGSELVGMIPLDAIIGVGKFYATTSELTEKELVQLAIDNLGLEDLAPFIPKKKIIEYALD